MINKLLIYKTLQYLNTVFLSELTEEDMPKVMTDTYPCLPLPK